MHEGERLRPWSVWLLAAWLAAGFAPGSALSQTVRFNRDIRPLLATKCFACHGPGVKDRKTKLLLDSPTEATLAHGDRRAIVPGDPDGSELVRRIFSNDPDVVMPPASEGHALSPHEKELFKTWITQGAQWEKHWAFIPPQSTPKPAVTNAAWPINPIDNFILTRLEAEGVMPSPDADRRTLLRRLSFDLTGLPPSTNDIERFVHDTRPSAHEEQVARLLASPQFGERMAMYWLDLVRYADTDGYHADNPRSVWPYRDYVVNAFHRNVPFDTFTRWQLAGDLIESGGIGSKVASGYNMLIKTTEEEGANETEYRARYAADRVRNLSSAWLGLTLGCAECHDHKTDPFTQRDFYSLAAFFSDLKEPGIGPRIAAAIPSSAQAVQLLEIEAEGKRLAQRQQQFAAVALPQLSATIQQLQSDFTAGRTGWKPVRYLGFTSRAGRQFETRPDNSVVVRGPNTRDDYTVEFAPSIASIRSLQMQVPRDPEIVREVERAGARYEYALSEVTIEVAEPDQSPRRIPIVETFADVNADGRPARFAADNDPNTSWAIGDRTKAEMVNIMFQFPQPLSVNPNTRVIVRLDNGSPTQSLNIRHFRLRVSQSADAVYFPLDHGLEPDVAGILTKATNTWSPKELERVGNYCLWTYPERRAVDRSIRQVVEQKKQLESTMASSLISETEAPHVTRILARGNWMDEAGLIVEPTLPATFGLAPENTNRLTRLDLANWLVSRDNPLTARVFVNRLWKLFFGSGLVTTLDDFGTTGDWPSHPELLDQLALEFMASGWNVKHLVDLMVTSHTYRQTSAERSDLGLRDPQNRLFARQGRWRLDAEMIRDSALFAAGIIVTNIGGPTIFPYQPDGYLDHLEFPQRTYTPTADMRQYRRGLYAFWQRTFLHPALSIFDAPAREECVAQRPVSNTPIQALALLNNPTHVEAARVLASSALSDGGTDPKQRVSWIVRAVLGRSPDSAEQTALIGLYERQRARLTDRQADAKALGEIGMIRFNQTTPPAPEELAAWTAVARAVLNLHEVVTRY